MRIVLAALALLAIWPATDTAAAGPYRWCAEYGDDMGGSTSCYFVTLEQCRASISGNGGFCRENYYPDISPGADRRTPRRKAGANAVPGLR